MPGSILGRAPVLLCLCLGSTPTVLQYLGLNEILFYNVLEFPVSWWINAAVNQMSLVGMRMDLELVSSDICSSRP